MNLKCKLDTLNEHGTKIMNFTKGNTYECEKDEEEIFYVEDDNGKTERFFNINSIFEIVD